jgi:anti-sigma B factor antagonist
MGSMIRISDSIDDVTIVTVAGNLDVTDVVALRNAIGRIVSETESRQIVIDVSDAHHLGPRGLATLVDEKALLMRRGGDLHVVLRCDCESPCEDQAGLERLFRLHPSVDAALAHAQLGAPSA